MPTAIPVAPPRPALTVPLHGRRRVPASGRNFILAIAVLIACALAASDPLAAEASQSVAGAAATAGTAGVAGAVTSCTSWRSLTEPPPSIRVLRRKSGRIETIGFRKYVIVVMGREWPGYLPQAVVEAGAVAVKQYAWYHAVFTSRTANGRCYDVRDGVTDQLYKPAKARVSPEHHRAIDLTWGVTIYKNGRFIMTGYRRGDKVRCGRDATGYRLYARSAISCARRGQDWRQILRTYYGPDMTLVGDGGGRGGSTGSDSNGSDTSDPPATPPETGTAEPTPRPATPVPPGPAPSTIDPSPILPAPPATSPETVPAPSPGAVGGSTSGGLDSAIVRLEERLMLLWLASTSLV